MKTYTPELTEDDIKLIDDALKSHALAAGREAMMSAMLTTMLAPKEGKDEALDKAERDIERKEAEGAQLKRKIIRLQAKIYNVLDRPEEFAKEVQSA